MHVEWLRATRVGEVDMATAQVRQPERRTDDVGDPTATLDEIDIRAELLSRAPHPPDHASEERAFAALAKEMAENPRNMLQKLVETAVELCHADTAGISLLEGDVFRWEAVAGVFASYRNGTMPRGASPCGICIDRDTTQLMRLADRCFPALRADPRFVEALLIPFHFQGKPVGTVWIVAHTDERKFDRGDERIVRALSEFASAGWQLWKAREAAEEASRRKDEFLAMLGHELRNPLAAILTATDLLAKTDGTMDERAQRAVAVVARQSQHLTRMVEDLLDLSRITQGKLELHKQLVELRAVVADALESARAPIDRRGHDLAVDLPAEPVWLEADAVRLAQLLANLLDNAAKYTLEQGRIRLTAEREDGQVRISVEDTGIGIPQEQLGNVFTLFKQLGTSLERAAGGLGVGLALVRSLAEMHGGSVEAASEGIGKGSKFTVRLPVAPTLRAAAVPTQAKRAAVTSRRVLLVDDNEDLAEGFAVALAMSGHAVRVAQDGPAALEAMHAFAPDLVLLDIGLPGMDGCEVARRMRMERKSSDLTIVALSGYGREEDRRRSAAAGCDAHLVKPVDIDELLRLVGGSRERG